MERCCGNPFSVCCNKFLLFQCPLVWSVVLNIMCIAVLYNFVSLCPVLLLDLSKRDIFGWYWRDGYWENNSRSLFSLICPIYIDNFGPGEVDLSLKKLQISIWISHMLWLSSLHSSLLLVKSKDWISYTYTMLG